MAFPSNKTTGRAIADIRGIYFYDQASGEPVIDATLLASTSWYPVLTLRGTVNASQDAPSVNAIHVDQFDPSIGITTDPGDFTFEAFLPEMTAEAIAKWLNPSASKLTATIDGNTREGYGYDLDGKLYDRTVLIETRTGDIFIFARAQFSFSFGQEDKVFGFRLNGQITSATNPANKMAYFLTETPATPGGEDDAQ